MKNKPRGAPILSSFLYPRFTLLLLNWPLVLWDLINPLILKSQWDLCDIKILARGAHTVFHILSNLKDSLTCYSQKNGCPDLSETRYTSSCWASLNGFSHSKFKIIIGSPLLVNHDSYYTSFLDSFQVNHKHFIYGRVAFNLAWLIYTWPMPILLRSLMCFNSIDYTFYQTL